MPNRDLTPWTAGRGLAPFARDPFTSFRREVDRLFDDFFAPTFAPAEGRTFAAAPNGGLWPSLDVRDTDKAFVVTAELPGLELKDVDVTLRDDALVISGEKRQERQEEDGGRRYSERSFGRFERIVPLEAEIEADKIEAGFKNGVLTVTLPKNPKAQDKTRKIEIRPS